MNKKPIRVLLVEDSPVALTIFKRLLGSTPEIEIVGMARTGIEGLELIPKVQPQVICTDLHMPQMDGLEFTREVMAKFPRPILVISSSVQAEDTQNVFKLLKAGAVDVFPKPRQGVLGNFEAIRQELIGKIKVLSGVAVFTLHRRNGDRSVQTVRSPIVESRSLSKTPLPPDVRKISSVSQQVTPSHAIGSDRLPPKLPETSHPPAAKFPIPDSSALIRIVAIGASTGGPQALHTILSHLPQKFPVPVICVQHISEGFLQGLVDWLASESHLPVKIAAAGARPEPGVVYFPPERKHLELDTQGRFSYSTEGPVSGHRPSVTVTLNSVADRYRRGAVGVLLTGMGRDGADGMLAIAKAGGLTIAQNESTCVVFGMPKEAIALGAAHHVLPISDIAPLLIHKVLAGRHV